MDENFEKITENGTWEEIAGESADDTETEEREFSEIEQKALSMGWKPKEEFEGNPDDWRDAKEYVDRDSLFRKIHNQGRELRKTQEALNALIEHNKKLSEAQREAERERLNAAKAEALEDGDYGKATNIDTEIDAMNQAEDDILNVPEFEPTPEESELFVQFKDRNQWYGTNEEITEVADMLANRFVAQKQAAGERYTEQDVYSFVESRVPNHFPDYFGKKTTR